MTFIKTPFISLSGCLFALRLLFGTMSLLLQLELDVSCSTSRSIKWYMAEEIIIDIPREGVGGILLVFVGEER